jgi:hypothetical protein
MMTANTTAAVEAVTVSAVVMGMVMAAVAHLATCHW